MLWSKDELKTLFGLDVEANGVAIDSRALQPGDLFFGLMGENGIDGMEFASVAKERGAVAAIPGLENLERLGEAGRLRNNGKRIAVTGSVGKTGTKELLATAFGVQGRTHASTASFNNHIGVPLTLARLPRDTQYGVFEMGMNHAGELRVLSHQVKPHVALITWIAEAHLEFFGTTDAIADAKAEIFEGMEQGGVAILPIDNPHCERLADAAKRFHREVMTFGVYGGADACMVNAEMTGEGVHVSADIAGTGVRYFLPLPGLHVARNSVGALAAVHAAGGDVKAAAAALEQTKAAPGRGQVFTVGGVTVLDESYNANPDSMRATLATLASLPCHGRRIAVLGDMFELGPRGPELHAGIADTIKTLPIERVVTCGALMDNLHKALPFDQRGPHYDTSAALAENLASLLRAEDCVLIKGSNGMKMKVVLEAIRSTFA